MLGAGGAIRAHDPAVPVSSADHLKLRVSGAVSGPVRVLIAPEHGVCKIAELGAPAGGTVPGAIALEGVPPGRALVIIGAGGSQDELLSACASGGAAWDALTAGAERIPIEVAPP